MAVQATLTTQEEDCSVAPNPFSFEVRLGLSFIAQAACFSALAVTGLLLYIGVRFTFFFFPNQVLKVKESSIVPLRSNEELLVTGRYRLMCIGTF